jgi:hypothetical protein
MKVNYPINKRNTQLDFSDNFHNIKNFVQVDHFVVILKTVPFFLMAALKKTSVAGFFFPITKNEHILMPDYRVKISANLDHHALHNMSSNPTVKISETDNNRIQDGRKIEEMIFYYFYYIY